MSSGAWGGGRGEGGRVDCVEGVWSSVHTCGRGVCTERGGVGGGGGGPARGGGGLRMACGLCRALRQAVRQAGKLHALLCTTGLPRSCCDADLACGCRVLPCCVCLCVCCSEEVEALSTAVKEHGMALVVFAEW